MLGPIGRVGGNFLKARGYEITRPTWIERKFLRSPWPVLFGKDPHGFAEVYAKNRETLNSVPVWIDAETMANSLWRYGVPKEWDANCAVAVGTGLLDVEQDITAADLLGFLARRTSNLSYLEIGVSVGKNLLQIANQVRDASIVGLDIEELNPALCRKLGEPQTIWTGSASYPADGLDGKTISKRSTLKRLKNIEYLSADQFREDTWKVLDGRKFNLIFSDGVHSAEALMAEFHYLQRYSLIDTDGSFHMFWDDLWQIDMQSAFLECAQTLSKMFGVADGISLFKLHGSYGQQRPMGLFSTGHRSAPV